MNKKLATFLFAIGLAVPAAPAFASCYSACKADQQYCLSAGGSQEECDAAMQACQRECDCPGPHCEINP